ncbi:homoprotocatechuate degradation operon regulator HpaR [Pseudomonas jinjuensis]|uniref:Homoprotocatechuate degradation operon regulator, HpaR n=1 Tax=Pseudomonas jinjuensis TaxID=198616 RepID=A0A1H0CU25_9PSED|nr:homoprotocatechuate degradation operon regulator HpaR [Pseudomonas jinjuensis]SDN61369.1 homoprotocatechuate degradation operon regulator, HpaR [Pseudomonas jinjuensis]
MPTRRISLTLSLLQAREAAMRFFRPQLNLHGLTEQQWRVICLLRQHGELESHQLAHLACILRPSMSGVLARLERDGMVRRRKLAEDQRRVMVSLAEKGEACFQSMSVEMERNYRRIQEQLGEEKLTTLIELLGEVKGLRP